MGGGKRKIEVRKRQTLERQLFLAAAEACEATRLTYSSIQTVSLGYV